MFGLFKKKDPIAEKRKQYESLMKKSFELSKIDRRKADIVYAEADEIMKEIEAMEKERS